MKPQALIFDVFGTLVDWRTSVDTHVTAAFASHGEDVDGAAFADAWRARYQPAMEEIRAGRRDYTALDDLHRENLIEVLGSQGHHGIFEPDEIIQLARCWEELDPWPNTVRCLQTLKITHIIAPCSNGSIALMTRLAKYGRLPWDCILGADIAHNYKPDASVYHAACHALRLEPEAVMMVACHNSDLAAAKASGLQTGFFPRPTEHGPDQTKDLVPEGDWTLSAKSLEALTGMLME